MSLFSPENFVYIFLLLIAHLNNLNNRPEQGVDTTRTSYYTLCSLSYLVAMVSSNKALMWVNYPTQVENIFYYIRACVGAIKEHPNNLEAGT